jgi:hypothetical protein
MLDASNISFDMIVKQRFLKNQEKKYKCYE